MSNQIALKNNSLFFNQDSERQIIGGILKYGHDLYYDIIEYISHNDFSLPELGLVFHTITNLIEKNNIKQIDVSLIIHTIKVIDESLVKKYELPNYLLSLSKENIARENIILHAKRIARASLLRNLYNNLGVAQERLIESNLDKPILEIAGDVEKTIFDFNSKILNNEETTSLISDGLNDYFEFLSKNKRHILGIPTGFPLYDYAIGGGIRSPGVAVIGARSGVGKTTLAVNIAMNVSKNNIKILYLDTEMTKELTQAKLLAICSDHEIFEIERGGFENDTVKYNKIKNGVNLLNSLPLFYHNVSGLDHSQIIAIARKWLHKEVGFDANGNINPCLIILDYIKTMDVSKLRNIAEHQYLGQYLTDMHNFGVKYNIPILAMVQLNRDGIDKEDSGVVSGSDRILWLCTSLSFLKRKSDEDLVSDPIINGNLKLIINKTRFGPGLQYNEYINILTDLSKCKMSEGKTNLHNKQNKNITLQNTNNISNTNKISVKKNNDVTDDDSETIPF